MGKGDQERGVQESAWPKWQSCIGMRDCEKGSPGAGEVKGRGRAERSHGTE